MNQSPVIEDPPAYSDLFASPPPPAYSSLEIGGAATTQPLLPSPSPPTPTLSSINSSGSSSISVGKKIRKAATRSLIFVAECLL